MNVVWPYFQQFLYYRTLEFMFVSLIIAIYYSILKYLLIRHFIFVPFCEFQALIHIIAILDLGDTVMT